MDHLSFYTGIAAGTLTTISFLPQLIKVYRSKHTHDISLMMFLAFSIGVLLWLIYGIMKHDTPVIIANSVTLILALMILGLKIKYK